jgi:ABC-2 type transport system permease protein
VSTLATQIGFASRRSVQRILRQPGLMVVPVLTFPLFLLAINTAGLDASTKLPGFPASSYVDFAIVVTFMQAALFASTTAGTELANDIQSGFLNRLQLTPLRGTAVMAGVMAGAMLLALFATLTFVTVGLIAGVKIESGLAGVLVLIALAQLIALAFGSIGLLFGAQTGSPEAVQGLFPLLFVTFFLSSINLPRPLIEIDWFRTIATWNPVSYMVEGLRSLIITGWDGGALWRGFLAAGVMALLGLVLASRSLRTRMERT